MANGNENNRVLGLSDLRLLMDNYQNIVQMNTILIEQQKQVIGLEKDILKKQDDTCKTQFFNENIINNMSNKIDNYAELLKNMNNEMLDLYAKLDKQIIENSDELGDKINTIHIDNTKEHSSITNKIYIAMVASASVVLSLIALLVKTYEKYGIMSNIQEMLVEVLKIK